MKKIILSASAIALLFTACKKDDDNNGGGGSNTFKIGSSTYTAINVIAEPSINRIVATDGDNNTFTAIFETLPTTSGTYNITNDIFPDSNQVFLSAIRVSDTTSWLAKDDIVQTATVTVSGGKISLSVPAVMAEELIGTDSVLISATLKQTN